MHCSCMGLGRKAWHGPDDQDGRPSGFRILRRRVEVGDRLRSRSQGAVEAVTGHKPGGTPHCCTSACRADLGGDVKLQRILLSCWYCSHTAERTEVSFICSFARLGLDRVGASPAGFIRSHHAVHVMVVDLSILISSLLVQCLRMLGLHSTQFT